MVTSCVMRILTAEEQRLTQNVIDFFTELNVKMFKHKPMTATPDIAFMNYLTTCLTGMQIKLAIIRLLMSEYATEMSLKKLNEAVVNANNQWFDRYGEWRWRYSDDEDESSDEKFWRDSHKMKEDWQLSQDDDSDSMMWILEPDPDVAPAMFYLAMIDNGFINKPHTERFYVDLIDAVEQFKDAREHPFDHTGEVEARRAIITLSQNLNILKNPQLNV